MFCDGDPDPPNILESDKVKFFSLNDRITLWPSVNRMLSDSFTRREGGCFPGECSLNSRSGGLTVAVIYFYHKHSVS